MYGLPQASILAKKLLQQCLGCHGYFEVQHIVDPLMLAYRQTVTQQALTNANTTRNVVRELT
jgi:hypothetical protein